jgi:hypothetical protein
MPVKLKVCYSFQVPVEGDGPDMLLRVFEADAPAPWAEWDDRQQGYWVLHSAILDHIDRTDHRRPPYLEFAYEVLSETEP